MEVVWAYRDARQGLSTFCILLTSLATAEAIEARFAAGGASEARLGVLAQARDELVMSLRTALSEQEMSEAKSSYEAEVEAELQAELGIDFVVMAAAETALETASVALDASVSSAGTAGAIASAYETFYTTAEASVKAALSTTANAELGAGVITLLSAH